MSQTTRRQARGQCDRATTFTRLARETARDRHASRQQRIRWGAVAVLTALFACMGVAGVVMGIELMRAKAQRTQPTDTPPTRGDQQQPQGGHMHNDTPRTEVRALDLICRDIGGLDTLNENRLAARRSDAAMALTRSATRSFSPPRGSAARVRARQGLAAASMDRRRCAHAGTPTPTAARSRRPAR